MLDQPGSNITSKSILAFRFIIIFVVSSGIAEMVEIYIEPHFSSSALIFELLEHSTLVSLLLLFMSKLVVNPMLREMALRRQSEQLLERSEKKNRNIVEAMPDAVLRIACDGTVIEYQPKQNADLSFTAGTNVSDSLPADVLVSFLNSMNSTLQDGDNHQIDLMFRQAAAVCYHVFNFVKSADNEVTIFIRDITRRKVYEEQLRHLSSHDVLTGLYNRTFYEAELARLAGSRRYPVSIIVIDLDGLKITNDSCGHAAGDKMICKAAGILKSAFRADDLVARTGGDEFTVLLPEAGGEVLKASVNRIGLLLDDANNVEDGFFVQFSLGTAIAETNEMLHEAVRMADMRMYQNKATRKSISDNKDVHMKKFAEMMI
ncbi:MAG: GGDEF domain-containing protein [Geobacteraceae bacterium]|nr:GGDEF domain-containing protein [Geobacteraceae bacterium]